MKKTQNLEQQRKLYDKINKARQTLQDAGYYVWNIYHIEDVKYNYDCTDDEAMQVLEKALDNDGTANQIWESINYFASEMGLKESEI
tara:strand:+ start:2461 stop:2721 length:261 start_codon:yes stop_codon:yes gene_type:complete